MAHWHRLILALGMLLALPILGTWGVVHAAQPLGPFRDEPTSGLVVTLAGPAHHVPLMPGGTYREVFAIASSVNSVYDFALRLSTGSSSIDSVHVLIEDALGRRLYDGQALGAAFNARYLAAGQTDWITVAIGAPANGKGLAPGTIVHQAWTATAQPT